ncbi:PoNe immunity protein domain-containing protein [Snodgrassella communis]|uniref:PoNe immunity protein domain-containing protein n=1 Tax=Snodgrassella communis TaxID=2946699 RepID=UPI001EF43246|nr:PoNe immunity protein domain-containing protein [Snodgrassella communis]
MELRDKLNSLEGYQEIIDLKIQFIKERFEKIEKLKKAEKEGKQLFNKPNLEVFKLTESTIVNYYIDLMKQ